MTDFDPGDGWRKLGLGETTDGLEYIEHGTFEDTLGVWVREEPVPPLPTEQNTVIRVTWREPKKVKSTLILVGSFWQGVTNYSGLLASTTDDLVKRITGFEVLAVPPARVHDLPFKTDDEVRRETAKAVLNAVFDRSPLTVGDIEELREQFEVD